MRSSLLTLGIAGLFLAACSETRKPAETIGSAPDSAQTAKADTAAPASPSLTLQWETDTSLRTPESVLFDSAANVLYVSNINGQDPTAKDGNGFISKLSLDGKITTLKWATGGLNAPKGMGLLAGKLYVTDINRVVVFDAQTGRKLQEYPVAGAQFLNDVTVQGGKVYFSDSNTKKVHVLENGKVTTLINGGITPNGLLAEAGELRVVDFESGDFSRVSYDGKTTTKVANVTAGGDGIVAVGGGDYLVSNWNGEVYYVAASGTTTKLLDTKAQKLNAADIEYVPTQNLLLVPTFYGHKIMAYQLKR